MIILLNFNGNWLHHGALSELSHFGKEMCIRDRYIPLEDAEHLTAADDPAAFELLAAIRKLPDKLHAVMVLHYLEGLSVEETASCLRISIPAAKMRLARGRQRLKELLGAEG